RLTIVEIKAQRIEGEAKRRHVRAELAAVKRGLSSLALEGESCELVEELRRVNEALWEAEDGLRDHEGAEEFGEGFVGLARSVYRLNDQRSGLKRRLNELLTAAWQEQKQYGRDDTRV